MTHRIQNSEPAPILVVDDIPANRALLVAVLEDADYAVVEASSGEEALAAFAAQTPACVLLDVRMPGMDGFVVCAKMRALPGGSNVPILFVTALRDIDTFDQAMLAGGFDFLTKPVRPNELLTRVRAALALRQAHVEREDLATLLRQQRDDLTRALLLNERLAAFLVHDLKNPIAGMKIAADLIARDKAASEQTRDLAVTIKRESERMLRMVLELLDISRHDEGRLELARSDCDIRSTVATLVDDLEKRAALRQVTLVADVDARPARVDKGLFRRVLENLVDNALGHSPPNSTVRIVARDEGDTLVVSVHDQGRGVPPEMRERIFERFVRGEQDTSARVGRGLGLAFCKIALAAHGGTIHVEDAKPGAVFVTRWPREAADA